MIPNFTWHQGLCAKGKQGASVPTPSSVPAWLLQGQTGFHRFKTSLSGEGPGQRGSQEGFLPLLAPAVMLGVFTVALPGRNTGNVTSLLFPHQPRQAQHPHWGLCGRLGTEEPSPTARLCFTICSWCLCELSAVRGASSLVPLIPLGRLQPLVMRCQPGAGPQDPKHAGHIVWLRLSPGTATGQHRTKPPNVAGSAAPI